MNYLNNFMLSGVKLGPLKTTEIVLKQFIFMNNFFF